MKHTFLNINQARQALSGMLHMCIKKTVWHSPIKVFLLTLICSFSSVNMMYSQEEDGVVSLALPVRNSLTFNRYAINPTFSFVREQHKYISLYNKREWVQFDDAPQTYLAGYSGRFAESIGAGIGLFQQNYGVLTTFGGVLNFAYNARLNQDSNLTFGLNLGVYKSGLNSGKVITNFSDPSLDHIPSHLLLTVNPGINYGTEFMDFGVSVNNLVLYNVKSSELLQDDPRQTIQAHMMYTGYIYSGGFFDESKFSGLLRSEFGKENTTISGIAMLTVPKGIWAQVGYNTLYGASGGLGLNITKQVAIEYNYEKAVGDLSPFGPSHEVTLAFKFNNPTSYDYSREDEVSALFNSDNKRVLASSKPRMDAETRAQLLAESTARREEVKERAKDKAETRARLAAEAKARADARIAATKARQEEQTRANALAKSEAELDAQVKLDAQNKIEADAAAKAKQFAAAKANAEDKFPALEKANAEARAKAASTATGDQEVKDRLAAQVKAEAEEAAKAKLAAEVKAKADQEAKDRLATQVKVEAEAAAKAKLAAEAKAKADQEAKDRLAAQVKAEAAAKAKLAAEAKAKAEAQLVLEEKAKIEAEETARLASEEKARQDAEALAKVNAENAALAEKEQKQKAVVNPTDAIGLSMKSLADLTDTSKSTQDELLAKLNAMVNIRDQDLKSLKQENDLSEQGIYSAPKAFKSITEENNALQAVQSDLENIIKTNNERIKELERLYEDRAKIPMLKNDEVILYYQKAIQTLKAEQATAIQTRAQLLTNLKQINEATEFERRRRIKRATYTNEEERYVQDRQALKMIKQNTPVSAVSLKAEDFNFGEEQSSNIQILKNVNHIESGYYVVVAVHNDAAKRDEFLTKAVAAGQPNIDFFFDVSTSRYFIYYKIVDSIEAANDAMETKGNQPYNGKMSIIKIEN